MADDPLLKKGKQLAKGPTVVRTASHQTTIQTDVVIGKKVASLLEAAPAIVTSTPVLAIPLNQHPK